MAVIFAADSAVLWNDFNYRTCFSIVNTSLNNPNLGFIRVLNYLGKQTLVFAKPIKFTCIKCVNYKY